MTWKQLQAAGRVRPHVTSKSELEGLLAVVERDLKDAALPGLSDDRRFATAYNAALQLSKMVIACAGYRITAQAHHQSTFEALELAMGKRASMLAAYFDTCRRKRNQIDYDLANVISEDEASELLAKVEQFAQTVQTWIKERHPKLAP